MNLAPSEPKVTTSTPDEKFREGLLDLVAFAEKVAPVCVTVADLIGMCSLALSNDGQLRLLMAVANPKR